MTATAASASASASASAAAGTAPAVATAAAATGRLSPAGASVKILDLKNKVYDRTALNVHSFAVPNARSVDEAEQVVFCAVCVSIPCS